MKNILFFTALLICFNFSFAQNNITGTVVDNETGNALENTHIRVLEMDVMTNTGSDGEFVIEIPSDQNVIIKATFVGYEAKEVKVSPGENVEIRLNPDYSTLGTVVVTATRGSRDIYDVPARVDVLKKENIENIPALTTDDYLWAIPGISISRSSAFLSSSYVSLRGMGSEAGRTLVMLDGVPVNKTDGGSVNWNAINPEDIEQIEVLKGPGSSIYGGNAMGGVINFISPTPEEAIEGYISQTIGTFNTYNSQAGMSGREKNLFWSLNGRYRNSDGYITTPADEIDEFTIASFLDEYQFGGRIGYFFNPNHMMELSGSYYDGKRGTGSNYTGYGLENEEFASSEGAFNQYRVLNSRINYRGQLKNDKKLNITVFGQRENYQNIRENVRNDRISRYDVESIRDDIGLMSSLSIPAGNHIITGGVDVRNGAVDGADIYVTSTDKVLNLGKMNQLGLYVQDEISLGSSPWSILAGIRYDYSNFYDGAFLVESPTGETEFLQDFTGDLPDANFSAFSPRLSFQYHIPQSFRIYAGYSRGFRAPVLDDMCRTGRISGGMKIANPDLKPEYLDNIELGGDIMIGNRLTVSPAVYYSEGTDYHAYIATGDSIELNNRMRPIRKKDNIGKVSIMGAELGVNLRIIDGLDWRASYSYTDVEIKEFRVFDADEDEDLVGKKLVYQPQDIFYTSLSWRNRIVNVQLSYSYRGEQYMDEVNSEENRLEAYNYIDLHLWRQIYKGLSISVMLHNLLDEHYIGSKYMIAPGRMINAELKYSF